MNGKQADRLEKRRADADVAGLRHRFCCSCRDGINMDTENERLFLSNLEESTLRINLESDI